MDIPRSLALTTRRQGACASSPDFESLFSVEAVAAFLATSEYCSSIIECYDEPGSPLAH